MKAYDMEQHAKVLAKLEAAHAKAVADYATVKALDGQKGYDVTVNGVRVAVAAMDHHYNGALIRGREMIHLGALKALDALVDKARQDLVAYQLKIKQEMKA